MISRTSNMAFSKLIFSCTFKVRALLLRACCFHFFLNTDRFFFYFNSFLFCELYSNRNGSNKFRLFLFGVFFCIFFFIFFGSYYWHTDLIIIYDASKEKHSYLIWLIKMKFDVNFILNANRLPLTSNPIFRL